MNRPALIILVGPPGTGKTTIIKGIVESYKQIGMPIENIF